MLTVESREKSVYFAPGKELSWEKPATTSSDAYESDPMSPVPYQGGPIHTRLRFFRSAA